MSGEDLPTQETCTDRCTSASQSLLYLTGYALSCNLHSSMSRGDQHCCMTCEEQHCYTRQFRKVVFAQRVHLGVGFTQAPEQAAVQALLRGCRVLDQRGKLVVVPYEAECMRAHEGAQHSGERDLPGLVHDAHVEDPVLQQRVRCAEACAADLSCTASVSADTRSDINNSLARGHWAVLTSDKSCFFSSPTETESWALDLYVPYAAP